MYDGSAGGTFGRDSSQGTISYLCDYGAVTQFLDVVLGKSVIVSGQLRRSAYGGVFDTVGGSLPEEHPTFSNFYAATAEVEPLGVRPDEQPGPFWNKARVTVVFRPNTYNVIPDGSGVNEWDRFTTKTVEAAAEVQTSQGPKFQFVTTKRVLDVTPGQTLASLRVTYTWHQVPVATRSDGYPDLGRTPNQDTYLDLLGKLNSTTFDGYPPGTLLLLPSQPKLVLPQVASSDSYYWDLTYSFGVRDYGASSTPVVAGEHVGWNYAYDPLQKSWDLYTTDGTTTGGTMYEYADMSQLFTITW